MSRTTEKMEEEALKSMEASAEEQREKEAADAEAGKVWFPESLGPEEERPAKVIRTITGDTKAEFAGRFESSRDYVENAWFEDLRMAALENEDFSRADLKEKDFACASLRRTNLSGSSLEGADLRGVDLRGSDLSNADLRRARFDEHTKIDSSTKLDDANVEGADLSTISAEQVSKKQLQSMKNVHLSKLMED